MKRNIIIILLIVLAGACTTQKQSEKFYSEKEYWYKVQNIIDSLSKVKTSQKDSIIIREKEVIEVPINTLIEADCDSVKDFRQKIKSGNLSILVELKNGKLRVEVDKDSTQILYWRDRFYKSEREKDSILIVNKNQVSDTVTVDKSESEKETVIIDVPWYKKLLSDLWFILFCVLFILWVLGITPMFLIKKLI